MSRTNDLLLSAYEHYSRDFSIASSRGSVTKDLLVCVRDTQVTYKTVVNCVTVYEGSSSLEAAKAYNAPNKVRITEEVDD